MIVYIKLRCVIMSHLYTITKIVIFFTGKKNIYNISKYSTYTKIKKRYKKEYTTINQEKNYIQLYY